MSFRARHLLGIEHLAPDEIRTVLDLADTYVDLNRRTVKSASRSSKLCCTFSCTLFDSP